MNWFSRNIRTLVLVLCAALALAGCGKAALYDQISENDANEMLSVLGKAGIVADKSRQSADGWKVVVSSESVAVALEILTSSGLPRERFRNIGDLFPKEGLISTPVEEHMRTIYALSQELGRTISHIDGVIEARVHISLPDNACFQKVQNLSSASVFIKYRAEVNMQQNVLAIKDIVVGAVKNLTHAQVMVSLFPWTPQATNDTSVEYTQVLGVALSPRSYSRFIWLVSLPWLLLSVLAGLLIILSWRHIESLLLGSRTTFWKSRPKENESSDD